MSTLALLGGEPVIKETFERYRSIADEELRAGQRVIETGILSAFVASPGDNFCGGKEVKNLERAWEQYFGVKHAVAVNSCTSGLMAAVGAIGIEPGDEVIVPPWTMSATATAVINWNGIPVFADVDSRTFNIDPDSVESNISSNTKAIIAVDVFGQSADMDSLRSIANKYSLSLISDSAQAPGARYSDKFAGTLADVGGFSLNYHKHIHTGEGGICVTNNDVIADRLRLIRNHAEAVADEDIVTSNPNMIGYNFRMGEVEAAIGYEQLKKLKSMISDRQRIANALNLELGGLDGLLLPHIEPERTHVYYVYPLVLDSARVSLPRSTIVKALTSEGVPGLVEGYMNLHRLPMYKLKKAYGKVNGLPWSLGHRDIDYRNGICPIAEELHDKTYFSLLLCDYFVEERQVALIIEAFKKVWNNLSQLR